MGMSEWSEVACFAVAAFPLLLYVSAYLLCCALRALRVSGGWTFDMKPRLMKSPMGDLHPAILVDIPFEERLDFFCIRSPTYPLAMLCGLIALLGRLIRRPVGLRALPDELFGRTFSSTLVACHLDEDKDTPKRKHAEEPDYEEFFSCDMSAMAKLEVLPGCGYVAGTVVHFGRKSGEDQLCLRYIDVSDAEGVTVEVWPEDKEDWEVAKLYSGMNAKYMQLYAWHQYNHFRFDSINGVTKRLLRVDNPVYMHLEPYLRHMASLDDTVLNDESVSPLSGAGGLLIYDSNAFAKEQLQKLMAAGLNRDAGKSWIEPNIPASLKIGPVYKRSYELALEHTREELAELQPEDLREMMDWVEELKKWHKDFPEWEELEANDHDGLKKLVAHTVWCLSVSHSLDHQTMFNQPDGFGHMRLRVPPPTKEGRHKRGDDLHTHPKFAPTFVDVVKDAMFHWMFVTWCKLPSMLPGNSGSVATVVYRFASGCTGEKKKKVEERRARHGRELEILFEELRAKWKDDKVPLPTIRQVAPSVQW